jgi:hypothetical protein
MAQDMVGRFVAHDKGEFIGIGYGRDQGKVECKDRAAIAIDGLKRIRGLARAVIDNNLEIAIGPWRAVATFAFGNGLNRLHN